jgi:D-serine deaminase-like pyridoxal phosphate-dependent protein
MIDMATRIEALAGLADDPAVAAVVLDVVLGYGSHADPAGALAPAIAAAKARAAAAGRHLCVVAFACGTEQDPQALSSQRSKLAAAGALLAESSTAASRLAATIAAAARRAHQAHGAEPVAG